MENIWRLLRMVIATTAVLGILTVIIAILRWDGFFNIQTVNISYLNSGDVPKWLQPLWIEEVQKLQKWKDKDLATLELSAVEKEIREEAWVKEVRLARSWPKQLEIQIAFKDLVAYGRTGKGKLIPLLEDGNRLPPTEFEEKFNLPLLTADLTQAEEAKLQGALHFLQIFPNDGSLNRDRISEVGYDSKDGYWTVILPWGTRIKWGEESKVGDSTSFERKISRVRQVVDYLESRRIEARVIDANLSKKVVVRLRKTP